MEIRDKEVIRAFRADPGNTFLVSFPRTGSHWLRMLMELYFKRPSLRRIFYYPDRDDYLSFHTHDLDLKLVRSDVIYLFRDPVDTVYSLLSYYREDLSDIERILHWSDLYGRHLSKWLVEEEFTTKKTVLYYERMRNDLPGQFLKICEHFGTTIEQRRLEEAATRVTREHVDAKTPHDPQVIALGEQYRKNRERFRTQSGRRVWSAVLEGRTYLESHFGEEEAHVL